MNSYAIIGLGVFGCRMIDELLKTDAELIIIDKDREIIEKYKNYVLNSYITDAMKEDNLKKLIPEDINGVIVDFGNQLETSILVTNILKKIGVKNIIVKARSDEHGEILKLVGATKVVYPDLDAAIHITPMLISSSLSNYIKLSEQFAIAEVKIKKEMNNKTLMEIGFRQKYKLNVIGIKKSDDIHFETAISPSLVLKENMILLVAGSPEDITNF